MNTFDSLRSLSMTGIGLSLITILSLNGAEGQPNNVPVPSAPEYRPPAYNPAYIPDIPEDDREPGASQRPVVYVQAQKVPNEYELRYKELQVRHATLQSQYNQVNARLETHLNRQNAQIGTVSRETERLATLIQKIENDFVDKIKNLKLGEKQALEKYLRAYIYSLDQAFILEKSTDLDYESIRANFSSVFAEKQKQLAEVLKQNPNIYPLIQKLSTETKKIVDTLPKKLYKNDEIIPNFKKPFEYLKKLYALIHTQLLILMAHDVLKLENPFLFNSFFKWYSSCNFYYLKNDEVFKRILEIIRLKKARYQCALESEKIEPDQQHNSKLDGLLSKDFSKQILTSLDSQVLSATSGSYTNGISMLWADNDGKLKAKINVWKAKYKFYEHYEKVLLSLINSHNKWNL